METDRELLELAAKAAALYVQGDEISGLAGFIGLNIRPNDCPGGYCWNPLIDDGDALRLAVKLGITIYPPESPGDDSTTTWTNGDWITEPVIKDEYAATRRAIVRAAAAIARATGEQK